MATSLLIFGFAALRVLSFPNFLHLAWTGWQAALAWVAVVPLLISLGNASSWKSAWWRGWWFGWLSWLGILYWIAGMTELGMFAIPAWAGFAAYLACYEGIFGILVFMMRSQKSEVRSQKFQFQNWIQVLAAPSAWVLVEWLRSHLFTGFPWALMGSSQFLNLPILQWASIAGVYGVSFIVVFVNAGVATSFQKRGLSPFLEWAPFLVAVGMLHGAGWFMYRAEESARQGNAISSRMRVALLQGSIPQSEKWEASEVQRTFDFYEGLVRNLPPVDLVIWPETALPVFLRHDQSAREKVEAMVKRTTAYHAVGAPDADVNDLRQIVRQANSVYWVSPSGEWLDRYDKAHLVPFGEFTPFAWLKPLVARYTIGVSEFRRGEEVKIWETFHGRIAPSICYEAIFPQEIRKSVSAGAQILVNVTNDAWYGRSSAAFQHAQAAAIRAVEFRRDFVRAANTGVSIVVASSGRLLSRTSLFERISVVEDAVPSQTQSAYTRAGDWWMWGCVAVVIGAIRRSRRKAGSDF